MEAGQKIEVNQNDFLLQCMQYRTQMIQYARRLMGTHFGGDIEDLVQDVLIKATLHRHQFKPGTNLRAWLFTIVHHSFMNHQRKSKRTVLRDTIFEPADVELSAPDKSPRPGEHIASLIAEGMRFKLQTAVDQKPATIEEVDNSLLALIEVRLPAIFADAYKKVKMEYRVVFALVDMIGFEYSEVAALLNMPIGTVMSRIYRGRNALASDSQIMEIENEYGLSRAEGRRDYTK